MNNRTGLYVLGGTAAVAAMFTKPMIAARETEGDTGAEARTDASSLLHTRVVEEAPSGYVLAEVYRTSTSTSRATSATKAACLGKSTGTTIMSVRLGPSLGGAAGRGRTVADANAGAVRCGGNLCVQRH